MYYLYNHSLVVDEDLERANATLNDKELKVRTCLDEAIEAQICELSIPKDNSQIVIYIIVLKYIDNE